MSFGRSTLRLNEDSVGLILQACLGIAKDFNVFHLLRALLANPLLPSSTFGVEEVLIGVGTMIFGV